MSDFKLPTNIKQIGSIGDGLRIYVEDYAHSFIKSYAKEGESDERIGFLIGKYLIIDSQSVVFISGVIKSYKPDYEDGIATFSDECYTYVQQQINKYFKGFEIVGAFQSQPGYSVYLNPTYGEYFMNNFKKRYQSLFVIDPVENSDMFYIWNEDREKIVDSCGYFIYYDKNIGMHNYMIDSKDLKLEYKEKAPIIVKSEKSDLGNEINMSNLLSKGRRNSGASGEKKSSNSKSSNSKNFSSSQSNRHRNLEGANKSSEQKKLGHRNSERANLKNSETRVFNTIQEPETNESKRLINMLVSMSAVLAVICFVMGAGLLQNSNKINNLQLNLDTLSESYEYVSSQLFKDSESVFSNQEEAIKEVGDELVSSVNDEQILSEQQSISQQNTYIEPPLPVESSVELSEEQTEENNVDAINLETESQDAEAENKSTESEVAIVSEVAIATESEVAIVSETPKETEYEIKEKYVVQKGDSLTSIAIHFYGSVKMKDILMEANDLEDENTIYFGKVLLIPKE